MDRAVSILQRVFALNRVASSRTEGLFPRTEPNAYDRFDTIVAAHLNARRNLVVVDVGAGRECHFAPLLESGRGHTLIGVDVSADELAYNDALDERIVADATAPLPFADASVDLVVSSSTLEHLAQVQPFLQETHRILKPGGGAIHVFPSKFAPYSIINQVLPSRLSTRIVHLCVPDSDGVLGFPAFYDRTYARGMERLLAQCGFVVDACEVSYEQASFYFGMVYPAYLAVRLYEQAVRAVDARNLAAAVLLAAHKP
ncbi:MAG: class I SAM-dependent methyltransferase [Thermomicrobiales bacterium]|nr:class I SAM-dependent methyltransferase [Thermomicrobiales bacterium]